MTVHTIVTADYNFDTCDINLYTRDEEGEKHHLRVIDFEPYFYSTEEIHSPKAKCERIALLSIYKDKLFKVTTEKPKDVKYLRKGKHFEADVPFPRRFLVDSGIKSSIEIEKGRTLLQWRKIQPSTTVNKIRKAYCDIETYSKGKRFPSATDSDAMVTMICLYDDVTKKYLSVVVTKKKSGMEQFSEDHHVKYVPNEKSLLNTTLEFLEVVDPDIFMAWYLPFDKNYLDERAKIHDITFPWERTNDFDLLGAYKKLYHKSNNELASVVKGEELNIPRYKKYQHEMLEKDMVDAILTNKSHVESIVKLDERKRLSTFYWNLKNTVGFESMNETLFHGRLVDIMLLRYYHNKWALPSHPSEEEKRERKLRAKKVGGKVLTPPYGVFENLGVFDMSRYYPEMLISQNLSPEPHARGELGIVPKMALDLIEERLKFDRELAKHTPGSESWEQLKYQRNSVKFVTESIIGYFGSESSRIYDLDLFNSVTEMGQRGLLFLQKVCNKDGNKVIYGDTDGLTVKIPNVEKAIAYVDTLNNYLKDFGKTEGIKRDLSLKLDRFYSVYLIKKVVDRIDGEDVERGVKKRYAGRVCLANLKKNVVWTSRGRNKPVGEVRVGDKLMAFDGKKIVETEVREIIKRTPPKYLRIEIERNNGKKGEKPQGGSSCPIIVTPEHPFYINGKWVESRNLRVGDELFFTSKNEKQRTQFKYDQSFIDSQHDQTLKNNQSEKMRTVCRERFKNNWKENREQQMKYVSLAVDAQTQESIEKAKKTKIENGTNLRLSELKKKEWSDPNSVYNSKEYREKNYKSRHKRPSYLESLFISSFGKHNLPLKYIGDGKFWLKKLDKNGKYVKRINPDFIVEGQKKVIEVYGSGLREDDFEYIQERTKICEENGYKCLFLKCNPKDFNEGFFVSKINHFIHNGVKIVNIRNSRVKNVESINFHCEPHNNYFVNGVLTHNCWEDGKPCDYLSIKGFEYVRRDASPLTKKIQPTVFDFIFNKEKEKVGPFLKKEIDNIKIDTFDDIAIPVTLNQSISDYGGTNKNGGSKGIPPYVRGAIYSNQWFGTEIRGGDQIKMIYVERIEGYPQTDVISYIDLNDIPKENIKIDVDKMIEQCVKKKIEDILELIDLSWDSLFKKTKNLFEM